MRSDAHPAQGPRRAVRSARGPARPALASHLRGQRLARPRDGRRARASARPPRAAQPREPARRSRRERARARVRARRPVRARLVPRGLRHGARRGRRARRPGREHDRGRDTGDRAGRGERARSPGRQPRARARARHGHGRSGRAGAARARRSCRARDAADLARRGPEIRRRARRPRGTARVSGFSAEWLALREPHDAAARAEAPVAELAATGTRVPGVARVLVDLGAGSGANLRWLAPRLGGQQDWLLVDHEHALLAAIEPRLSSWAAGAGVEVARVGDADGTAAGRARVDSIHSDLALRGATFECRVRRVALDLAGDLDRLEIPHGALVTSSALLDLVSAEWLEALARRCRDAAADVCFALTYDGRTVCVPA